MSLLGEFTGGRRAGTGDARDARDEAVATMTALAPMTRIVGLDIPSGTTATIDRTSLDQVHLVRLTGFDYGQVATAATTDGVPEGISLAVRPSGTWSLTQGGVTRGSANGDVLGVVDVTRAMRVECDAGTELLQLFLSADQLGLSVDAIRAAAAAIERSPLQPLVAAHVVHLSRIETEGLGTAAGRAWGPPRSTSSGRCSSRPCAPTSRWAPRWVPTGCGRPCSATSASACAIRT